MTPNAGDLVMVPFPFTDLSAQKKRPALVLTPTWYNRRHPDLLVAYVTSTPQDGPWSVPIRSEHIEDGVLPRRSWIRSDKLFAVEESLVLDHVGHLHAKKLEDVRRCLHRLLVEPSTAS